MCLEACPEALERACPEVLEACSEALEGGFFATLRDSAARFLSANGINKTLNELNSLFNVVGYLRSG